MPEAQKMPSSEQLLRVYNAICDKLNCNNYVEVLAEAATTNELLAHENGKLFTLEEAQNYFKEASAYDNLHFVVSFVGDLTQALRNSGCEFEPRPFEWQV